MSAGTSNVGTSSLYEAGDQRNYKDSEINDRERFKESQPHSHLAQDSKDERSIANKLAREEKREKEPEQPKTFEEALSKEDSTLPAKMHGNKPSKGAQIDQELAEEEEEIMKKKKNTSFGTKKQ